MFSNVNKTFSQLVTKPWFKSTIWHNTWIDIINIVHRWIPTSDDVRFLWLKVHKKCNQRRNEIHMEISRCIGIIFGRHSGIVPINREKVNTGNWPEISTCQTGWRKVPIRVLIQKLLRFFAFWCDLQMVFWNLKNFNFLWRKKSAYYTPIGVLYPDIPRVVPFSSLSKCTRSQQRCWNLFEKCDSVRSVASHHMQQYFSYICDGT